MSTFGTAEIPSDTTYYEWLHVPVDTDIQGIKYAFKKLAILYHPDKNKNPDAEEKFKQLAEAYHVLKDPELRALYNKNGRIKDLEPADGFPDCFDYFNTGLGGITLYKGFIGDMTFQEVIDKGKENAIEELQQRQQKREEQIAKIMLERLAPYESSDGSEQARVELQRKVIAEIEPLYPDTMGVLSVIGNVYVVKYKMYFGTKKSWLPTFAQSMIEKKNIMMDLWDMVQAAADAKSATERLYEAKIAQLSPETIENLLKDATAKASHSMWLSSKFEAQATLRGVCDAMFNDKTIDSVTRNRRAEGLEIIGYLLENLESDKTIAKMFIKSKDTTPS